MPVTRLPLIIFEAPPGRKTKDVLVAISAAELDTLEAELVRLRVESVSPHLTKSCKVCTDHVIRTNQSTQPRRPDREVTITKIYSALIEALRSFSHIEIGEMDTVRAALIYEALFGGES